VYLFALNHFCYLTISLKEYQPLGAGWGLQIPEQEEKCLRKETGRKQVLANMTPSPGADTDWIKIALQKSAKTSAVSTMMKQVYDDSQAKVSKPKGQAAAVTASKKRKAQPKKSTEGKTKKTPAPISKDTVNTPKIVEETVVRRCGCRHGDLSAIKSFAKADAKYYIRQNKFLEGRSCLDCKLAVISMTGNARGQTAVVFYCDEGIKGFNAPDDDPLKSSKICDLILCPQCEAKRRLEYNKADLGHQSNSGVKRSRQRTVR
jgi:hypothetical protein